GIERLRSYRAGLEKLWAVVAPDDRLAVTSTHHGIPIDHNARRDLTLLCRYCHRLANADRKRRIYDRELQNGRLLLKGAAPPLKTQFHGGIVAPDCSSLTQLRRIDAGAVIGLHPQHLWIDDLKHPARSRDDWPTDYMRGRDHPKKRSAKDCGRVPFAAYESPAAIQPSHPPSLLDPQPRGNTLPSRH